MKSKGRQAIIAVAIGLVTSCLSGAMYSAASTISPSLSTKGLEKGTVCNFELNAPEDGCYFVEFWMLPALHADGAYSIYSVKVNGEPIGTITPTKGNWQAIRMDGNKRMTLHQGSNLISVSAPSSEFPQVESVKISLEDTGELFSSEKYDSFLSEAKAGEKSVSTIETIQSAASLAEGSEIWVHDNVPLEYSFHSIVSLTQDEECIISSSSSSVEHDIDIMFIGTPADPLPSLPQTTGDDVNGVPVVTPKRKISLIYDSATADEMQGLNWCARSETTLNGNMNLATLTFNVPKTGLYILRLRSKENGVKGVADINVNGKYFYNQMPISYAEISHIIPNDRGTYACMTKSSGGDEDDAMIFIYSRYDKIVGFNDDATSADRSAYRLNKYDACLTQSYRLPTAAISVCSYSSNDPKSTCRLTIRAKNASIKARRATEMTSGSDHPYVDLGLPSGTLWATCNIGAQDATEYGEYFAWGETKPKEQYSWATYEYYEGQRPRPDNGVYYVVKYIGEDISETEYDAATALWGDDWAMPTEEQMHELRRHCWTKWTEENGVKGVRFNGRNGNSVFFPASGSMAESEDNLAYDTGRIGEYWTATLCPIPGYPQDCLYIAYTLDFDSGAVNINDAFPREGGLPIRPVVSKKGMAAAEELQQTPVSVLGGDGCLTVRGALPTDIIEVRDLSGRLLVSEPAGEGETRLEIGEKGVYLVSVSTSRKVKRTVKIIL